jgi:biotin carboxyl carrier protein
LKFTIKVDGNVYEVEVDVAEPEQPRPGYVPPATSGASAPTSAGAAPARGGKAMEKAADESKVSRSPISGVVIRVPAEVGQEIAQNDTLMILEAMKMETVITAPISGKIARINAAVGDPVKSGQILVEFE